MTLIRDSMTGVSVLLLWTSDLQRTLVNFLQKFGVGHLLALIHFQFCGERTFTLTSKWLEEGFCGLSPK